MFKKNQKESSLEINQQEISTLVGAGFVITGNVQGTSVIRIDGKVIGNVEVEGGVILGDSGCIEGELITRSAMIYGVVHGNVNSGQLVIKKSGSIHGDITTDTLEIELGAHFNGKLNMQQIQSEEHILEQAS